MTEIKVLNKWDTKAIEVKDLGLKKYISIKPILVPKNFGRHAKKQFYKSEINIVERLMNHFLVPGHRGKRHRISSGRCGGKSIKSLEILNKTFKILEEKANKNPIEVLVRAIENAALREEITSFQVGGVIVRKGVITSPQRRIDYALRLIVQGSYQKTRNNPKGFSQCLADEILAAYNNDAQNSHAIREKNRLEREAAGAR